MKAKQSGYNTKFRRIRLLLAALMIIVMIIPAGCSQSGNDGNTAGSEPAAEDAASENTSSGDIVVLFTSDVHCGVADGWGYAGLQQIRDTLESRGNQVFLVDNGDAIQGAPIGTLTKGKGVAELMNDMGYDVAIPGNHEFGYGMDNFLDIAKNAAFPYICCNLTKEGKNVFDPYVILEKGGKKIAFIGATTPKTLTSSTPKFFQDENGKFIYDFLQEDLTGQAFYDAIQKSADDARAEGADYVILMCHLGMGAEVVPWDSSSVAVNTSGIDAILDGHSHDYEQIRIKNKDGVEIPRSACGTKMKSIGCLRISSEDGSVTTGLYNWGNDVSATELLGLDNEMSRSVSAAMKELDEQLEEVIGKTSFGLFVTDPAVETAEGQPVRIARRAETNLGDLVADAFRDQTGADIGITGGGHMRADIKAGDITYGDLLSVLPFNNDICVSEVTGQQILDALEWGVHAMPNEFGGFIHVSGMTYEIDANIPSTCTKDKDGLFSGVTGERRVRNVMVGGEPIDPAAKYTIAGADYTLKNQGDGMSMFSKDDVIRECMLDSQALLNYIQKKEGGVIGEEYADPYGQERIVAVE